MTVPPPFLFDLDGTLADTLLDISASLNHVRKMHGLPSAALETVRAYIGDGSRTLLRRALQEVMPHSEGAAERLLDAAFREFLTHHVRQCTVAVREYQGVRAHLEALAARGHALAVVTNKPEQCAELIVRHLGLHDLLAVVVGGDTLPQRKPDPAPLRHALRQLGEAADRGTMVGDGLQDLAAGRALGMQTIACLFGYGDPASLRAAKAGAYWRSFGQAE